MLLDGEFVGPINAETGLPMTPEEAKAAVAINKANRKVKKLSRLATATVTNDAGEQVSVGQAAKAALERLSVGQKTGKMTAVKQAIEAAAAATPGLEKPGYKVTASGGAGPIPGGGGSDETSDATPGVPSASWWGDMSTQKKVVVAGGGLLAVFLAYRALRRPVGGGGRLPIKS